MQDELIREAGPDRLGNTRNLRVAIENLGAKLEPGPEHPGFWWVRVIGCGSGAYFIKGLQCQCESLSFAGMKPSNLPADSPSTEGPINPVAARAGAGESRCFRSGDLFGLSREVLIEHDGGYYRLRLTQANKLILTK